MDTILELLNSIPILAPIVLIIIFFIVLIYIIAFFQGREISFWPPKIGPKTTKLDVEGSKHKTDNSLPHDPGPDKLISYVGAYPRSQHPRFFAEVEKLVPT